MKPWERMEAERRFLTEHLRHERSVFARMLVVVAALGVGAIVLMGVLTSMRHPERAGSVGPVWSAVALVGLALLLFSLFALALRIQATLSDRLHTRAWRRRVERELGRELEERPAWSLLEGPSSASALRRARVLLTPQELEIALALARETDGTIGDLLERAQALAQE